MYTVPAGEPKDPGWRFVGLWVLACVVGSGFGFLLIFAPLFFVTIPVAQWFGLRRYIRDAGWWIPASIVGLLVTVAINDLILFPTFRAPQFPVPSYVLTPVVAGLSIGVAQFMVLRRSILQAGWWILLQILALFTGTFLALIVAKGFLALIVLVVVYSIITGLSLRLLLTATPQAHRQLRWLLVGLAVACGTAAIFS